MNSQYRKPLPGTSLDYFDARAAVDALQPGAYATLPYTARVQTREELYERIGYHEYEQRLDALFAREGA